MFLCTQVLEPIIAPVGWLLKLPPCWWGFDSPPCNPLSLYIIKNKLRKGCLSKKLDNLLMQFLHRASSFHSLTHLQICPKGTTIILQIHRAILPKHYLSWIKYKYPDAWSVDILHFTRSRTSSVDRSF